MSASRFDLKRTLIRSLGESVSMVRSPFPPRFGHRILLYHSIGTALDFDPRGVNTVSQTSFEAQMSWLRSSAAVDVVDLSSWSKDLGKLSLSITFDDGYRDNLTKAAPILVRLGLPFTVFVVPAFVERGGPLYLNRAELKELAALPGARIGCHSSSHVRLTKVPEGDLAKELQDSRRWLEDFLEVPVVSVAYPFGATNARVRDEAARSGYELGVTTRFGINRGDEDPLLLLRTEIVGADSSRVFAQKVNGHWDWYRYQQQLREWVVHP